VVRADAVVVATHSAFLGISSFDARVAPYQSYVLTAELDDEIGDALFWDDESPYHYIRRASSQEPNHYIVGGEDHKTGQGDERERLRRLEDYLRAKFRVRSIQQRWSAELFAPSDGVPYIGRVPLTENLFVATGFEGTGLTWGTAAGRVLSNLILGIPDSLSEIVTPLRLKPLAAGPDLIKENWNVAKRFVIDRFQAERVDSIGDVVGAGEGKIVEYQGELVALYRDPSGTLYACSAKCTHAGCIVQWNDMEKTWDCPCHGGRYQASGERIYGPPADDLADIPRAAVRS
jgi:Rieske Fe-S protein